MWASTQGWIARVTYFLFCLLVAIGDDTGMVHIYNEKLEKTVSFQAHTDCINRIRILPNGLMATSSKDNSSKLWDPNAGWTLNQTYKNHLNWVYGIEYYDGDIATGSLDQTIQIWSPKTGTNSKIISVGSGVRSLQLKSDDNHFVVGLSNNDISIIQSKGNNNNNNNNFVKGTLKGHTDDVLDVLLITDDLLASASKDTTVRIWDLTNNLEKFKLTGHNDSVFSLKLITCDMLASGSKDSTIKLWNITSGELIRTLTSHASFIYWSIDMLNNHTLISGSFDKTIKIWDTNNGSLLNTIQTGLNIRSLVVVNLTLTSKIIFILIT